MSVAGQLGHGPPPFFKRGPAPLALLAFYLASALFLLTADLRFHLLEPARMAISAALWPVQKAVMLPVEGASDAGGYFADIVRLQKENADLRQRQTAQANLLLRQAHLDNENRHLRALLDMRERLDVPAQAAEILHAARDPFSRRVIIDRGSVNGIENGQAVIDDIGVIGQVTRVFPLTSEVTLLTDKNQAIPVKVERNGLRAVLAGAGAGALELKFLPNNADVQPGDTLVTSGLDGIYLPGLPVARVTGIDRENATFASIQCAPLAGVERQSLILVLGARTLPEMPIEATTPTGKPVPGDKSVSVRKQRQAKR